jgi:hypothetical protein
MEQRSPKTTPEEDAIIIGRQFRGKIESGILQQVQNEIDEVLLLHAPKTWSDERLDDIERQVLGHTSRILAGLSTNELRSPDVLQTHIDQATMETKRRVEEIARSLNKWLYPHDPELKTVQVTFPQEDMTAIDDAVERLADIEDREQFISLAVQFALSSVEEEATTVMVGLEEER